MPKAPLELVDDWDIPLIQSIPNWQTIAWSDEEAFQRYRNHNFVYDKLYMGIHNTNLKTYDLSKTLPNKYPLIVKPRVNLFGMGLNSYIVSTPQEIEDREGMIAQEISVGNHLTSDLLIKKGKILDIFTFQCFKNFYGSFIYFKSTKTYSKKVMNIVSKLLPDYTGVVCVEYIGDNIIDCHLRPALQFFDISADITKRSVDYLNTKKLDKKPFEDTVSLVYRTRYNRIIQNKPKTTRQTELNSVTYTYDIGYPLGDMDANDEFTYRYMYLNGTNLNKLNQIGMEIREKLKWEKI